MCCFNSAKVRTIFITRSAFLFSKEDVLSKLQQSMMYRFQSQFNVYSIDKTSQRLEIRLKQYLPREFLIRSQETTSGSSQA